MRFTTFGNWLIIKKCTPWKHWNIHLNVGVFVSFPNWFLTLLLLQTHIRNFPHVVQKDTWIIITILSQQIKQINSIEHKKLVAWVFWANQGFLLAAEHTGGTTLPLIASINFRNSSTGTNIYVGVRSRSGLEVYREADWKSIAKRTESLSLIIIVSQIIFLTTRG